MDDLEHPPSDAPGGMRGTSGRSSESGLQPLHESRLEQMAVRKGWIKGRWPLDETVDDLKQRVKDQGQTLRDKILIATHRLVGSENDRAMGIGVRSGLAMEAQNQADEHRSDALAPPSGPEGATETIDQIRKQMLETMPGCRPADTKPEA